MSRQIFDFVYSIFQENDAAAIPGPPPPFQPNIIAESRMRDERRGVAKEKNKFDQSEGGSYRFGYGFRKRRRILFLRKPDKGPFTRIFSHTRRLHLRRSSYASRKRDENITTGLSYHPYINQFRFRNFFVNLNIFKI